MDQVFTLLFCKDIGGGTHVLNVMLALNWLANHGPIAAETWYFVDFSLDTVAEEATLRVNAAADGKDTAYAENSPPCVSVVDLTTQIWDGGPHLGISPADGRIAGCGFRRGSLWSDAEIAYLYNGGCQILYGEVDTGSFPAIFDDLYCWWDMQELDATRDNAEGTAARDFLEVGDVSQQCGTCWECGE
jgi:hypothetical protein